MKRLDDKMVQQRRVSGHRGRKSTELTSPLNSRKVEASTGVECAQLLRQEKDVIDLIEDDPWKRECCHGKMMLKTMTKGQSIRIEKYLFKFLQP